MKELGYGLLQNLLACVPGLVNNILKCFIESNKWNYLNGFIANGVGEWRAFNMFGFFV